VRRIILLALLLVTGSITSNAKIYRVFYLGGQSNMDGYGYNKELPAELKKIYHNIYIFQSQATMNGDTLNGKGVWSKLQPGHGMDFRFVDNNNKYGERFGLELSFAQRMQELLPHENIAIIKYSKGGTSIDTSAAQLADNYYGCWDPDYSEKNGINQWDHFLATLNKAFAIKDIDGDGESDQLIPAGILWMQGESDAWYPNSAMRYEKNLKHLMDMMRAALRSDDLPVVIGQISDSKKDVDGTFFDYGNIVRYAQKCFVEKDSNAALLNLTETFGYIDVAHYRSIDYINLGKEFAEKMVKLNTKK
jgi:hypothetical protein